MSEQGYEFTGKSTEEAIEEGLNHLNLSQEQVEIEIINKGSRGIFGIGSEPARVRITPKTEPVSTANASPDQPATAEPIEQAQPEAASPQDSADNGSDTAASDATPQPQSAVATPSASTIAEDRSVPESAQEEPADTEESDRAPGVPVTDEEVTAMATEMLSEMIELMGFNAHIVSSWREPDDGNGPPSLVLDIRGEDVSPLIGRQGETLASIQYLIRLMVNQRIRQWKNIVVDVEQYKERRVNQLTQLAQRMADQVAESGRAVSLEPMPASERRIVHIALRDHAEVYTQSSGEGDRRKVHIVAKEED